MAYFVSLVLGGIGFISTMFIHDQYMLFVSYILIGCAWAAMLALPFTILTNSISGKNMGTYLGLFNGTICLPQIIAASIGGVLLSLVGGAQVNMLVLAGILLILGAASVFIIKETSAEKADK
jgi:maltose/moltooligosaccharide transporter